MTRKRTLRARIRELEAEVERLRPRTLPVPPEPDWELIDVTRWGASVPEGKARRHRAEMHADWHSKHLDRPCERTA